MEKAEKYLKKRILKLAEQYGYCFSAAYEFKSFSDTFFVEIQPEHQYGNGGFKEGLADIILDFDDKFREYSLVFISNDKLIKLKNPTTIVERFHIQFDYSWLLNNAENYIINPPTNVVWQSVKENLAGIDMASSMSLDLPVDQIDDLIAFCSNSAAIDVKSFLQEDTEFGIKKKEEMDFSLAA